MFKTSNSVFLDFQKLLNNNTKIILVNESETEKILNDKNADALIIGKKSDVVINADLVRELYHCYEFSDKISDISPNLQFGGMLNLVDTGVLTLEEAMEAILH